VLQVFTVFLQLGWPADCTVGRLPPVAVVLLGAMTGVALG
jgi:hypothetical protein